MSELGDTIRSAREKKNLSQVQVGAHFSISKSAVNQWESGKNIPDQRKLNALGLLLEIDPGHLVRLAALTGGNVSVAADDPPPPDPTDTPIGTSTVTRLAPPNPNEKPDVPLWASAAAGDDGAIILVPDPIDFLRRSERMLSVRNPFAFNIIGASMSPAIEHGDQVIINPSIVARPGHDCVFIHEGAEGMLALVKRLLRPGGESWRVRQFNEPKDFDISRKKWGRVHPIAEIRKAGVG